MVQRDSANLVMFRFTIPEFTENPDGDDQDLLKVQVVVYGGRRGQR